MHTAAVSVCTHVGRTLVDSATAVGKLALKGVREALRGTGEAVENAAHVDPLQLLGPYLGWVQDYLADALVYVRGARGLLLWADPALTACLALGTCAYLLVAPLLPWLAIARVAGALALGPHMWILGARARAAGTAESRA